LDTQDVMNKARNIACQALVDFFGALELNEAHRYCGKALRTEDPHFSDRMGHLFPS
jgi:hypothetical protein